MKTSTLGAELFHGKGQTGRRKDRRAEGQTEGRQAWRS
jgi:hypothetical protein